MYLSEVARMSLQFGDIEKGVKFHHLAADTALEKSRYADAQINEVNEQMLVLIASAYDQGPMQQTKARQAGQSWNSVLHLASQQEANAVAAITSFLCYHGYHWTDSNWLQEAKLRLQFITKTHPYLRYHLCMVQALLREEKESTSTFMQFTNSPDTHGPQPGMQVVRMIGNKVKNPWQPLFDMVKNETTSIQPIKVEWRTQLGHRRSVHENRHKTADDKFVGELCEADNIGSNLSLHINSNGYLTGDMQLNLPSMRSVNLDPYTGVLSVNHIPGLTEPWQTLLADGSKLPSNLLMPTLLELYHDNKGHTVTLCAPQKLGESYSRMKIAWLHWTGASGEKAKINLFKLIKSEMKLAVDKAIEEMAGKTQKEKAEMKKICQLYYDHSYVCNINNIERALQRLASAEAEDNRRVRKKRKLFKRKKYFYLVNELFIIALNNTQRVGTNILLDVTKDGIHEFVIIQCTDKQNFLKPEFLKEENARLADCQYASSANIIVLCKGCLARLLENWDPLKYFFHEEQKKKPGKSEEKGYSAQKIDVIFQFLHSLTNRLYCLFLSYTIKAFEKVLLKFQAEEPMMHEVQPLLCSLLSDLYSRFIMPDAILNCTVEEVCFRDRQEQKADEDLLIGEARDFLGKAEENHL
ncbi:hypothetical protein CHS0354_037832 [Potamilus streckersoni]|uniref:Uncharacterized protein n=1 Tax=Potamilus streckersoni TaxID=2493646 RepID=A0AAE0VWG9_9BIVA|nr:hypothetical protein CHS0354_037832 [Potamilus streckersoni]